MKIIESIQAEAFGRIKSGEYFDGLAVFQENTGVTESDISIALGTMNSGDNGLIGAAVIVSMPVIDVPNAEIPGPQFDLLFAVRIMTQPLVNSAMGGTGKTAESLVQEVLWILHNFQPYGICNNIAADSRAVSPVEEFRGTGVVAYDVFFCSRAGIASGNQVAMPQILSPAGVVTLMSATSGAAIYYTLDDTLPRNGAGTLYTGPFTLPEDCNVRAVAYVAGMKPSQPTFLSVTAAAPSATVLQTEDGQTRQTEDGRDREIES